MSRIIFIDSISNLTAVKESGDLKINSISFPLFKILLSISFYDHPSNNPNSWVIDLNELAPFPLLKDHQLKLHLVQRNTLFRQPHTDGVCSKIPCGADGKVYSVAQGAVSIGGLSAGGGGANVQVNHPTVGIVTGGGLVEKEIQSNILNNGNEIELILRSPDSLTAVKIADAINKYYPGHHLLAIMGLLMLKFS